MTHQDVKVLLVTKKKDSVNASEIDESHPKSGANVEERRLLDDYRDLSADIQRG